VESQLPGPDRSLSNRKPRIGFLFLGGVHQLLHTAPVAAELSKTGRAEVIVYALPGEREIVGATLERFGMRAPLRLLTASRMLLGMERLCTGLSDLKVPSLVASRKLFADLDALVVAERTSTLLKRLPGSKPYLIHIPHGAGDRAKGFEKRIRLFDRVIVAGAKDRERMIAEGLVDPEDCLVSGYIKRSAVQSLLPPGGPERLFDNDRPVILYNPHFDRRLSSWNRFAEALITAVERQSRFNLVVAPHMRLRNRLSPSEVRRFEARARPDQIIVDFGSLRSCDMSYTLGADIYVGDVSSQVYEFLDRPKPCLFLNAGVKDWQTDASFAHWRLGEVIDDPDGVVNAVDRAIVNHPLFAPLQSIAVTRATGPEGVDAVRTAAELIGDLADAKRDLVTASPL
jgi:hypothetical protein